MSLDPVLRSVRAVRPAHGRTFITGWQMFRGKVILERRAQCGLDWGLLHLPLLRPSF